MNPLKKVSDLMPNPVIDRYINHYAPNAVMLPAFANIKNLIQKPPLVHVAFTNLNQNSD